MSTMGCGFRDADRQVLRHRAGLRYTQEALIGYDIWNFFSSASYYANFKRSPRTGGPKRGIGFFVDIRYEFCWGCTAQVWAFY